MKRFFPSIFTLKRGSEVLLIAIVALGLSVIAGWYLHVQWLVQALPDHAAMQFNTALCFVLSALALAMTSSKANTISLWMILTVLILSTLNLIQYLLMCDLRIDQLFVTHFIQIKTPYPGRMAPNTAIAFLLFSFSYLVLHYRSSHRVAIMLALSSTIITSMFGAAAVVGYLGKVETSYGWGNVTQMAFNTALGFIALGGSGFLRVLERDRAKNTLRSSVYSAVFGISITIFGVYMWNALSRAEHNDIRQATQTAVQSAKDRLLTRLVEVTHALRRMAERINFGMQDEAWQKDAEFYFRDFPAYTTQAAE